MISYEEAKKIGINACIEKIGRDFVNKHKDNACSGYGDIDDHAYCFVGISDQPDPEGDGEKLVLDDGPGKEWPYLASCIVWYSNGKIEFIECKFPNNRTF